MTDISPEPTPTAAPEAAAPEAAPPDVIPYDRYKSEVDAHVKERNLWKPYAQAFKDLEPADRSAILALADAVRAGDSDGIVNWAIGSVENVTGKSAAEIIAARQQAGGAATPTDLAAKTAEVAAANPLSNAAEVQAIVREAIAAEREEVNAELRREAAIAQFTTTMRAAGYEPGSVEGQEIIRMTKALGGDMEHAIKVFNAVRSSEQAGLAASAAAAAATPSPAPAGSPVSSAPAELSPRQRMEARLRARNGG